jgi:hypothetical protein
MQKLAIVGTHPATRELAPFDDPAYEIWVFNEAPQAPWCKRWDVCFQLHKAEVYTSPNNFSNKDHWDWLQQDHGDKKIYMQHQDQRVPNCYEYPLEEVLMFTAFRRQLTSSPAYALAAALMSGFRYIEVYGVELSSNTEYATQLNNWNYWVGYADGRGVELVLKSGECHFNEKLYGYEGETQLAQDYFRQRAAQMETTWGTAEGDLKKIKDRLDRALLDNKHQKALDLALELRACATAAGELSGALAEVQRCAERPDPIPRQEFERRAAQAQRDGEGHRATMYHAGGKIEYVWNVWKQTNSYDALQQLRRFVGEQTQAAFDLGAHQGIYQENLHSMEELDAKITAAGGQKTLVALGVN